MAYAQIEDLDRFFNQFATLYYYNTTTRVMATTQMQADLEHSYGKINQVLNSVDRIPIVPIATSSSTGSHNPFLIEWNCVDMIYTKLKAVHSYEFNGDLPGWMMQFGSRAKEIFTDIINEKITFDFDNTKSGIGFPINIVANGRSTLVTNWDSGFYNGSDYEKVFRIRIDGTSVGNEVGQSTYKISADDGYSWYSSANLTGTGWCEIADGFCVRWIPAGTLYGTQRQIELDDEWKVTCVPMNINKIAYRSQFKTFGRG